MMNLNQTSNSQWTLRQAGGFLILLGAALISMAFPASIHAAMIAYDNFDTAVIDNDTLSSRSISRGSWTDTYQSSTQIFGVTDRAEALSESANNLVDTSTSGVDQYGILKTTDTSSLFAVERPGSNFSATWVFDISEAAGNLSLGIDFAAMGDWSDYDGAFSFTASLDGGPSIDVFTSSYQSGNYTYYMEKVDTSPIDSKITIADPLTINGVLIDNDFQRLYADISEFAGEDTLTLTFTTMAISEPPPRMFAFDNIEVYASVPVPGTVWLLGAGFLGLVGIRRRFKS